VGNAALRDAAERGQRRRKLIRSQRQRLAVEVAAAQDFSGVREHQGVVGSAVDFDFERSEHVLERVPHRAMYLGHAAQAVGVLEARVALR